MRSKIKLLAIIGSQRKNGNSYLLAKTILGSIKANYEIIQLAEKEIKSCNLCGKCIENYCILKDDFNQIFEKMKKANGIIFLIPKYIFFSSKFLCFLERLDTIGHFRRHRGYEMTFVNPDYKIFHEKPSCIVAVSGTGKIEKGILKVTEAFIRGLGIKLILPSVCIKGGDYIGEVLKNKKGVKKCQKMIESFINAIKK
ncbi:MAG: NAD(P)H-dependent oxidoreductase [Candidatus Bathyarchaeia archaeon]